MVGLAHRLQCKITAPTINFPATGGGGLGVSSNVNQRARASLFNVQCDKIGLVCSRIPHPAACYL